MRRLHLTPLALAALVLAAASCQLVAGVRNDGELETDTSSSSSSAGGATSSSTDASSSSTSSSDASSSSTYMGPLCNESPCDGACIADVCYVATCVDNGPVFDVFTEAELTGRKLDDALAAVVSNGKALVGVTDVLGHELVVRDVDERGLVGQVTTFMLGANARFTRGRFQGFTSAFQGSMNGEIGEIRFNYGSGGPPSNGMFVSFGKPSPCTVNEAIDGVAFTVNDVGGIIYAANCSEPNVSYKLVIGGEGIPAELVDSGVGPTSDLRVDGYAFSGGTHLIITGDGASGQQPHFRFGASADALGLAAPPLRLSTDPSTNPASLFVGKQVDSDGNFVFWGADFTVPAPAETQLWTGVFADPATLAQAVPPPGFSPDGELVDTQTRFGRPGQGWPDPSGIYVPIVSLDAHHVLLGWLAPEGVPYLPPVPVVATTNINLHAAAASPIGQEQILVTWIEENSGTYSVRAQVKTCHQDAAP